MAKQATGTVPKLGVIQRLQEFIQEVKAEMSKVAWPSKDELKSSTSVVLILLAILAVVIAFYDVITQYVVFFLLKFG